MVILEVILAVCGILCIAASFLLTEDEQKTSEQAKQPEKTVLSDGQKEEIRRQVNELVTEDEQKTSEQAKQPEKTVLSDGQKEEIRRQVNQS